MDSGTDGTNLKGYYENSYEIIIGISKYKEWSPLRIAENDALAIERVLHEKYGFSNVISLLNENATKAKIEDIFFDTLYGDNSQIKERDRVIVYYSGHGKLRTEINYRGEVTRDGYIIPYDSQLKKYAGSIPMITIVDSCMRCMAKHILLILDCCFSGYAVQRGGETRKPKQVTKYYLDEISKRRAIQVFAAGQEDQPVSDSGIRPGYSAFTGALLDILESEEDVDNDGILTASEIGSNLERRVASQQGSFQMPAYAHISGSQGGDFIFKVFSKVQNPFLPQLAEFSFKLDFIQGSQNADFSKFNSPHYIALDLNTNDIYVTFIHENVAEKFSYDGKFNTRWGSYGTEDGQLNDTAGIAVHPKTGDVYIVDSGNSRIQKFSPDGKFITKWGGLGTGNGQMNSPTDISIGLLDNIFVTDRDNHRIQVFTLVL